MTNNKAEGSVLFPNNFEKKIRSGVTWGHLRSRLQIVSEKVFHIIFVKKVIFQNKQGHPSSQVFKRSIKPKLMLRILKNKLLKKLLSGLFTVTRGQV